MNRILFVLMLLALGAAPAVAQSPAQRLQQMATQLQANPNDEALRKRIIDAVRTMNPRPETPEDARRFLARGTAATKTAASPADFKAAANEFQKASDAAPWLPEPYYNMGVVLEKSGDPAGAMTQLRRYLLASPGASDAEAVRSKIYELEYLAEKKGAAQQQAAREKNDSESLVRSLEGAIFYDPSGFTNNMVGAHRVSGGSLQCGTFTQGGGPGSGFHRYPNVPPAPLTSLRIPIYCQGSVYCRATMVPSSYTATLGPDGRLTVRVNNCPGAVDLILTRR